MVLPAALARGSHAARRRAVWEVLQAFASFGFCKAHAAAFALPTYQSAWLKAHHPAAFLAVCSPTTPACTPSGSSSTTPASSASPSWPRRQRLRRTSTASRAHPSRRAVDRDRRPARRPATASGCRWPRSRASPTTEVARIVAGRPYASLADFWHRATVSRPVVERLVVAGAFDSIYGIGGPASGAPSRPGQPPGPAAPGRRPRPLEPGSLRGSAAHARAAGPERPGSRDGTTARRPEAPGGARSPRPRSGRPARPAVQLALDLGDAPELRPAGCRR